MTVTVQDADMFQVDADMYVCPTNARGIFGAGLALYFAQTWPHIVLPYQLAADRGEIAGGDVRPDLLGTGPSAAKAYVAMMATKEDPFQRSRMEWIDRGLELLWTLVTVPFFLPRRRLVMPAVGCGLGGLPFEPVRDRVIQLFDTAISPADVLLIPPKERR